MKKLTMIVAATLLLFARTAMAQTEKGVQTIGLTLGLTSTNNHQSAFDGSDYSYAADVYKQTNFNLAPSYSYFIADKLDLGLAAGYSKFSYSFIYAPDAQANSQIQHDRGLSASIFLRKYFLHNGQIGVRVGPYLGYSNDHSSFTYPYLPLSSNGNSNNQTEGYTCGLQVDFVYYPSKHIALAAGIANLSYEHDKVTGTPQTGSGNSVTLNFINNNLALSAYYMF